MYFRVKKKHIFTRLSFGAYGEPYVLDILALLVGAAAIIGREAFGMSASLYRVLDLVWPTLFFLPVFDGLGAYLFSESSDRATKNRNDRKKAMILCRLACLVRWFIL